MSLTYRDRQSTGTYLDVLSGDLVIGTINKGVLSLAINRETPWAWHFALNVAPRGFQMHSFAPALEKAKADMERNWQLWIDAARVQPLP